MHHADSNGIYDYPFWVFRFFEGCLKLRSPNYHIIPLESNAYRNNLFNSPSFENSSFVGCVQWFMIKKGVTSFASFSQMKAVG